MQSPYTAHPAEAYSAAQVSVALLMSAVGVASRGRVFTRVSALLWIFAVWLAALAPDLAHFSDAMRWAGAIQAGALVSSAVLSLLVGLLASTTLASRVLAVLFTAGTIALGRWLQESALEVAALHLILCGAVWGLASRNAARPTELSLAPNVDASSGTRLQDGMHFLLGLVVGALASVYVLERGIDSSDEWAYTYQAALFAKGRSFGIEPPCAEAFRNFWVFFVDGRLFAQYMPGWPLFMVPFVWLKLVWLAGPASLGLLAVFVGRLARRLANGPSSARVYATIAALSCVFANTLIINGGSRFPHIFVAVLWASALDAALALADAPTTKRAVWLGASVGWLAITRPPDALALSVGIAVFVLHAWARRRIRLQHVLAAFCASIALLGFALVTARLQVGYWGKFPYQLTSVFHPWNVVKYSFPPPNLLKWHLPLATGAYCWFPLAPAIGVGGLLAAKRSAKPLVLMLTFGSLLLLAYYSMLEIGRGTDFGYGPRYQLPLVVPMALGGAIFFGEMQRRARSLVLGFGSVIALVGAFRVGTFTFPFNHALLVASMAPEHAVAVTHTSNAIVRISRGTHPYGDWDVTRNYPYGTYANDVLYVGDVNPSLTQCLRREFSGRTFLRTERRGDGVVLVPDR